MDSAIMNGPIEGREVFVEAPPIQWNRPAVDVSALSSAELIGATAALAASALSCANGPSRTCTYRC